MVCISAESHVNVWTWPTFECKPHTVSHKCLAGIWCLTVGSELGCELMTDWALTVFLPQFFNRIIKKLKLDRCPTLTCWNYSHSQLTESKAARNLTPPPPLVSAAPSHHLFPLIIFTAPQTCATALLCATTDQGERMEPVQFELWISRLRLFQPRSPQTRHYTARRLLQIHLKQITRDAVIVLDSGAGGRPSPQHYCTSLHVYASNSKQSHEGVSNDRQSDR